MSDVVLRPGSVGDLAEVANVYVLARAAAVPAMPALIHPVAQTRTWVQAWDLSGHDVWLAEVAGEIVGFARATATWLDDLYVRPDWQGRGVGSALVQVLQALRPSGFGLWVFVSNTGAQSFYARHGFVEVGRGDGSENEEQVPDIEMCWSGPAQASTERVPCGTPRDVS